MTNPLHYLFLCALFASCTNLANEKTGTPTSEEKSYAAIEAPESDSFYITRPQFTAPGISIPIVRISKAKPTDSSTVITSSGSYHLPRNKANFYSLDAAKGNQYELLLNKHKKILLNSASMLVFHPTIPDYMLLSGEGYFELGTAATIEVNYQTKIKASAGTILNIKAYDHSICDIVLLKGNLSTTSNHKTKYMNTPAYELTINTTNKTITQQPCDTNDVLAWTKNNFNYRTITYKELLTRIANWYNKELIYPDSVVNKLGSFDGEYTESIPAIIDRVNRMYSGIDCRVEQNKLIVASK